MTTKLVSIKDFAEQVEAPVGTVRYWLTTGYAPPHAKIGRKIMFTQESIDKWVAEKFQARLDDAASKKRVP